MPGTASAGRLSRLEAAAARYRRELDAADRAAMSRILDAYRLSYERLQDDLAALLHRVEQATAAGETPSPSWLYREQRYLALQAQLAGSLTAAAEKLHRELDDTLRAAVALAGEHARGLVRASLGEPPPRSGGRGAVVYSTWVGLPTDATVAALGYLDRGSPLRRLLDSLAQDGAERIGAEIVDGITRGVGPREVARSVSRAYGVESGRALTILRTETMRAYREATRLAYQRNPALVKGWVWVSSLDGRTCAACWALHGTRWPTSEKLDGHPSCRCVMVPVTPSWGELLDDATIRDTSAAELVGTGEEAWARLTPAERRRIVGPGRLRLLDSGAIRLRDLATRSVSPDWGASWRVASTREAVDNAKTASDLGRRTAALHHAISEARRAVAPLKDGPPSSLIRTAKGRQTPTRTLRDAELALTRLGRLLADERDRRLAAATEDHVAMHVDALDRLGRTQMEFERLSVRLAQLAEAAGSSAERERIAATLRDLAEQAEIERERLRELEEANRAAAVETTRSLLEEARPVGQTRPWIYAETSDREAVDAIRYAASLLPRDWGDLPARIDAHLEEARGYYRPDARHGIDRIGVSSRASILGGSEYTATAIHELGHLVELRLDHVRSAEWAHYLRRTRGETQVPMSSLQPDVGYRPYEVTRPDGFGHPYIGRDYGATPDSAYEILSMGLEGVWAGSVHLDPETLWFVLGVLATL